MIHKQECYNNSSILKKILALREKGKNRKEIANILNLKYYQVIYLFHKYNLPQHHFFVTELEKKVIQDNKTLPTSQLAKILNRHISTISKYRRGGISDKEKQFIQDNIDYTAYRLSKILNRSRTQIGKIKKAIQQYN